MMKWLYRMYSGYNSQSIAHLLITFHCVYINMKNERNGSGVSETAIDPFEFVCNAVSFRTAEAGRGRRLLFIFLQDVREMFKSKHGYSPEN